MTFGENQTDGLVRSSCTSGKLKRFSKSPSKFDISRAVPQLLLMLTHIYMNDGVQRRKILHTYLTSTVCVSIFLDGFLEKHVCSCIIPRSWTEIHFQITFWESIAVDVHRQASEVSIVENLVVLFLIPTSIGCLDGKEDMSWEFTKSFSAVSSHSPGWEHKIVSVDPY